MAADWLNTCSRNEGKAFYRKHHQRLVQQLKDLGLYDYYEDASYMSLHSESIRCRARNHYRKEERARGHIKLTYQEVDDAVILFLWFCVYLRAQEKMIQKLPNALPEIDFSQIEIRAYEDMVENLWSTLRPLYIKKRSKGLPELAPGLSHVEAT